MRPPYPPDVVADWARRLDQAPPAAVLSWAADTFGPTVPFAFGFRAEDLVLLDLMHRVFRDPHVFYLDTGLLTQGALSLLARLKARYPGRWVGVAPLLTVAQQTEYYGPALWRADPGLCCSLRRMEPFARHLATEAAWITAVRREQHPFRAGLRVVEWDRRLGLVGIHPLAGLSAVEVRHYATIHRLPIDALAGAADGLCRPCAVSPSSSSAPRRTG